MNSVNSRQLFQMLLENMGPSGWWPADTKEEIIIGAILTQNTNWKNVEKALGNLKEITNFKPKLIKELPLQKLEELIKPSGFYKNKARTIKATFYWFDSHHWDYHQISETYRTTLREELLKIKGIGFETADVFLVYLFDQTTFIADTYARRLFGWLNQENYTTYEQLHKVVQLPKDFTPLEAKEFHGLIDEFGKLYLRSKKEVMPNFINL